MPRSRSKSSHASTSAQPVAEASSNSKRRRKRRKATAPLAAPSPPPAPSAPKPHRSHFTSYTPSSNSWATYTPPSLSSHSHPATKLTLLTLNTWSSSPSHSSHQSHALHSLIRSSGADVIALQETSNPFFNSLVRLDWVRRDYLVAGGGTQGWWGFTESKPAGGRGGYAKEGAREAVVLLVKRKCVGKGSECRVGTMERAKGEGGKGWIELRLRGVGEREIHLATSHFSSLPQNAPIRHSQYRTVLSSLFSPSPSPSASPYAPPLRILLADFNLTSPFELSLLHTPPYKLTDACPSATHPEEDDVEEEEERAFRAPPTFGHLYPWVQGAPRGKMRKGRRVDRVYFSSGAVGVGGGESDEEEDAGGGGVKVVHYSHLGDQPLRQQTPQAQGGKNKAQAQGQGQRVKDREAVDGWMRASDHAGVRVVLGWD